MTTVHFHTGEVAAARHLVMTHHYSHRWPSNVRVIGTWHESGGLFGDSGEAVAACVFAFPASRWSERVLELIRLVRTPDFDGQLSGLVAATARFAHRKGWPLLVSFADAAEGHHGGIYQACSWHYHEQRPSRMDGIVINGQFVPGRTCNHIFGTQSVVALRERGIDAEGHYDIGKHLYWKANGRTGAAVARRLGLQSRPYPKPHAAPAA